MTHPSTTISEPAQLMQKGTLYMDYGLWLLSDETGRITLTGWSETGSDSTDPNATLEPITGRTTRCATTARSCPRAFRNSAWTWPPEPISTTSTGPGTSTSGTPISPPSGLLSTAKRQPADHAAGCCAAPRQRGAMMASAVGSADNAATGRPLPDTPQS